jgi:NAD(P)-dependent dehydrogenase (short-subunit alcohol dehydrogenase family)
VIAREYFPLRIMGTVLGASVVLSCAGMALSPPVGGWIYDTTDSFGWLYIASFGLGLGATLIALSSLGAVRRTEKYPGLAAYVASKFAVVGLTEALAVESIKLGARTNAIAPAQ